MNDFIVHRVGVAADSNGISGSHQLVTRNGGGFDQGVARASGRIGGFPVGYNSIIYAGVLGVGVGFVAQLELELPDSTFVVISPTISAANTLFALHPGVMHNVPVDAMVHINITTQTSGDTFYYLETA